MLPDRKNPGPGEYELIKGFNKEVGSSLVSKTPNCAGDTKSNGIPGPGSYTKDLNLEPI